MKYFLFLDECGNHGLSNPDLEFPIFVLCGVLTTDSNYEIIRNEINLIKEEIWSNKSLIFHSRRIRRCEKEFAILFNPEVKSRFYKLLNEAVIKLPYTIIASAIQKNKYIQLLDKSEHNVYELALSFVLDQAVTIIENTGTANELVIVIEKRNDKEDRQLLKHFKRVCSTGTRQLSPVDLDNVCPKIVFRNKQENINGLQLADLIAYPIARYLMEPGKTNLAFEVLKHKIYRTDSGLFGLNVFP